MLAVSVGERPADGRLPFVHLMAVPIAPTVDPVDPVDLIDLIDLTDLTDRGGDGDGRLPMAAGEPCR